MRKTLPPNSCELLCPNGFLSTLTFSVVPTTSPSTIAVEPCGSCPLSVPSRISLGLVPEISSPRYIHALPELHVLGAGTAGGVAVLLDVSHCDVDGAELGAPSALVSR